MKWKFWDTKRSVTGTLLLFLVPAAIIVPIVRSLLLYLEQSRGILWTTRGQILFLAIGILLYSFAALITILYVHRAEKKIISERESQLMKLVARLEESNQELERFAYIASHDLQEPLRMVSSFTQLLARKYENKLDQEANEYIHFILDGAARMKELIVDLLAYSRIATKGKRFISTDSAMAVKDAMQNLHVLIEDTGAEVTFDELPVVVVDNTQFVQLFQNLISNAIKFNESHPPKVHISATEARFQWVFCVEDNGIGIEPQYFDQIFLIFQSLHHKKEYPGTGVGLAICKKIIDRHGGKIWVESEPGVGSKFYFTIPI